jgi:hypothetical protein
VRLRPAAPAALLLVVAGATACTADPGTTSPPGSASATASVSSSGPAVPEPPAPTLAGTAEARAVAPLPAGAATGTAVLIYSGVGEVREPFEGECSHDGEATRIAGSADTARILLVVAPDGAELALDDTGFAASSSLTTGRYRVDGRHLSLAAGLAQDGQPVGSVELEIDCGG